MLYFNNDKFDFWEIYESIKRFYPIGIEMNQSRLYNSYPGQKALEAIIIENIHDGKHFEERWLAFTKGIETETGKEIINTTYGQAPCFSSFVVLERNSLDNLVRTKELHFFVSLVGSFYTVVGADINMVTLDTKHYRSMSYLVVSPENEFADTFRLLCARVENRFRSHRFIPFVLCRQAIDGFEVSYSDKNLNTVFNALFNDHIEVDTCGIIGNEYYKSEDWIKVGYEGEGGSWTTYPHTE